MPAVIASDANPNDLAKLGLRWLLTISHLPSVPLFPVCSMVGRAEPVVEPLCGAVENLGCAQGKNSLPFRLRQ